MLKTMIFIDGTWLYRSTPQLGKIAGRPEYHLDYAKLAPVLVARCARQLGVPGLDLVRTNLYGSYPVNQAPEDDEMADRAVEFLHMLREEHHYEVTAFPVNFSGRRIRKQDRDPSDEFYPMEKCVDVALASDMLYYASVPGALEVAIVVAGDRDFIPAMKRFRQMGRRVFLASVRRSCATDLAEPEDRGRVRDGDVIWLDGLTEELELRFEPQQLSCASPLHLGDREVWTRYRPRRGQPFFCDECRRSYSQQSRQREADRMAPAPPVGPREGELLGRVKRMGRGYGFLTDEHETDYFFAPFSLVPGLDWEMIRVGDPVGFFPGGNHDSNRAPQATQVRLQQEAKETEEDTGSVYVVEE